MLNRSKMDTTIRVYTSALDEEHGTILLALGKSPLI